MDKHLNEVIVTGGFGFVGYHLVRHLLERTQRTVTVLGRSAPDAESQVLMARFPERLQFQSMDVRDIEELECVNVKQVYHLAARKVTSGTRMDFPTEVLDENLDTDQAVFCALATRPDVRLVYVSTGEVIGPLWEMLRTSGVDWPLKEHGGLASVDLSNPQWLYGLSKIAGEMRLKHGRFPFSWTIARLQNPYGPRMGDLTIMPVAMANARDGRITEVYEEDTRPYVYIDDVTEALVRIMESTQLKDLTVNIAGVEMLTLDVVKLIYSMQNRVPMIKAVRRFLNINTARALSVSTLESMGWRQWVSIEEGLARTWDYYRTKFQS